MPIISKNKKILYFSIFFTAVLGLAVFFVYFRLSPGAALGQADNTNPNDEIKQLNDQIQAKKDQIKEMQQKQAQYTQAIQQKQAEKASLDNQLSILDNRVAKLELDIETTQTEIERINLEISKTNAQIREKKAEIEKEKTEIGVALKLIYKQDRVSALEILLMNNSLSEFLNQARYLEDVNKELGRSLDNLKQYKDQLDQEMAMLEKNNQDSIAMKKDLEGQKSELETEKQDKLYLLEQTRDSERRYQSLLSQAKEEQLAASNDISAIERTVREKLSQISSNKLEFNDNGFMWPVPRNYISAYFHDPDYPFKYVFEHPAIDIRAAQGSPLRAAASGYVARVKDGGKKGYSYIMLVHGNGLSTVYGHVSRSYVSEDDFVTQGQIIGLTGGLPGTPGAGPLTTGPHLHFEVRLNGLPVDPLSYLP